MLDYEKSFNAICKFLAWLSFSFFICFIGISHIFASEHEMGRWTNYTQVLLEVPGAGAPIGLNKDTYNVAGHFTQVYVLVGNISINKDYIYQFEISTPGSNFTNVNAVLVNQTVSAPGVNQTCNMLGFADASIGYPKVYFQCPTSFSNGNLIFTLYNINGANLTSEPQYFKWGYSNFRYYDNVDEIDWGPVTSNANANADRIINNYNQKSTQDTRDIVNGAHQDANSIKNNQNANTDKQIDSQKVCFDTIYDNYNNLNFSGYLNSIGVITSSSNWKTSNYVKIDSNSTIRSTTGTSGVYLCFYSDDYTRISCDSVPNNGNDNYVIPSNTAYFRYSLRVSNSPTYIVNSCKNGNQVLSDNINGLNDNLNNDDTTGATSEASDFFSSFSTDTFGLTSIITAPLNLINSVLSSTCTSLQLPLPYLNNRNLELPCMSSIYSQYFGTFFTIYQTITYGIIAYWVCVRIFNQVKDFKNPEHDEIEVMDL